MHRESVRLLSFTLMIPQNAKQMLCRQLQEQLYDSDKDFVPSYHFPKDPEERERWRNGLPNIIQVCEMKLYFTFTIAYKM